MGRYENQHKKQKLFWATALCASALSFGLMAGAQSAQAGVLPACDPANQGKLGYNANLTDHTVSVVNLSSNTVVGTITGFHFPWNVAASPDGTKLFVDDAPLTGASNQAVDVVDTCSGSITKKIPTNGEGFSTVSPDGTRVFTTNIQFGGVQVIDTATTNVIASYATSADPASLAQEAVSADGKTLWIVALPNVVYSLDMATGKQVGNIINAGALAAQFSISPDGTRLGVADLDGDVTIIDTVNRNVIKTIHGGLATYASYATFSPDGQYLWVGYYSGHVLVIDMRTTSVIKDLNVGGWVDGVLISKDGKTAYISTTPPGSTFQPLGIAYLAPVLLNAWKPGGFIYAYDTQTYTRRASIPVGDVPVALNIPLGAQ